MKEKVIKVLKTASWFWICIIPVNFLFSKFGFGESFFEENQQELYKDLFIFSITGLSLGVLSLFRKKTKIDKQ
ncbi:MAG: hypothetical protein ACI7YS_02810 [Flavobacterium sp.]